MTEESKSAASRGGQARARALSTGKRSEIARRAATARWIGEGKLPPILAQYGAPDRPLRIGEIEIGCYVLADGRRVLSQRGLQTGIGLSSGGGKDGARKIVDLMRRIEEMGIDVKGLTARANEPIRFLPPRQGVYADGYEATILPDICAVLIEAGQRRPGSKRFAPLARRAAILQHGFATVGIVALVDEATGYQEVRAKDALARILEQFIEKELRPWVKTFPTDFYREVYRLNGWEFQDSNARPSVIGHWTNNVVYSRLAPGVLAELRQLTPRNEKGRLKNRLFQHLTEDIGHPKLREHLAAVVMLMKYSPDWNTFIQRLDREFPQVGANYMLPFPIDHEPPPVPDKLSRLRG